MARCTLIIASRDGRRLLVVRDGGVARLPTVNLESDWVAAEVGAIQASVRGAIGIDAAVLREIGGDAGGRVAELECLSDAPLDDRSEFVDLADPMPHTTSEADRGTVARWLADAPAADAPPWTLRGWMAGATAWMDAQLAGAGAVRTGPTRQIKGAWGDSAVIAAATSAGEVFLKATARDSLEPAVLGALSARHLSGVPRVLAIHYANNWILMSGAPGRPVAAARGAEVLRRLGTLQRAEAPHAAEWLALGVPDRPASAIRARLERLLVEIPRQLRRGGVLSSAESTALGGCVAGAAELCDRLAACGIPDTLAHDDFLPGNVLDAGDELVILDWSDVAVAHPLFSAHHFIGASGGLGDASLADACVESWAPSVGERAARDAFAASAILYPVYRAMFNDRTADYEAWLATDPPRAELEFARSVFTAILDAFSAAG